MKNQSGKISITGLIFFLAMLFGAFAGYKLLTASLMTSGIQSDIKQALYVRQGSDLTPEIARETILDILGKNKVDFNRDDEQAIWVDIEPGTHRIKYHVEYDFEIDFLFFKQLREVTIEKTEGGE